MMTLIALNGTYSSYDPEGGAIAVIIAALFYLAIGINIICCPVPKTRACRCFGEQSVQEVQAQEHKMYEGTVKKTFNVDGSVTIEEQIINPDGSTTIATHTVPSFQV